MAKDKKEKKEKKAAKETPKAEVAEVPVSSPAKEEKEVDRYEERLKAISPIAQPLANKKLTKKIYKVVKKAAKSKQVKRGVKEVVKGLRKGQKGFVVIAGDISPIDVITHLPVLCEESNVPYVYIPSKEDLGAAGATKRPTSCVLVSEKMKSSDEKEGYVECMGELKSLNDKMITTA